MDAESRGDECRALILWLLMVDTARSSSQAKNGVCDFVYVHFIVILIGCSCVSTSPFFVRLNTVS